MDFITEKTISFITNNLQFSEKGHDWWHIQRVWKTALKIQKSEGGEELIVSLGALLHDAADEKFHKNADAVLLNHIKPFLENLDIPENKTRHVFSIIQNVSFSKEFNQNDNRSIELKIIQDADRLDAMGAIGIARTFHFGGYMNREIFNPDIAPAQYKTEKEYRNSKNPTINHFYEKLLKLKDFMNTKTGKKLANERHLFMLKYLEQFHKEWNHST
jgi:uncharacterized protein